MNTISTTIDGEQINVAFAGDEDYIAKKYDLVQATGNTRCPQLGIVASTDSHWLTEHAVLIVMDEEEWQDFEAIRLGVKQATGENVAVNPDYTTEGYADVYAYASSLMGMGSPHIIIYPTFEETSHPGTFLQDNGQGYNVWVWIGD